MEYFKQIELKDGRKCLLRNGTGQDGQAAVDLFNLTHEQTDWLRTYPDENNFTADMEAEFLKNKTESDNEIEILAEMDGIIIGMSGIECVGRTDKVRHRAELGVSIDQAYWGLGLGRALTKASLECAKKAGYHQVELNVVGDNTRAIALYRSLGFVEYGRNPKGFRSRKSGWQELLLMRLELEQDH